VSEQDKAGDTRARGGPGGSSPPEPAEHSSSARLTRLTGWFAVVAIAASTLVMIVVSAAGPNVSVPRMPRAAVPPGRTRCT